MRGTGTAGDPQEGEPRPTRSEKKLLVGQDSNQPDRSLTEIANEKSKFWGGTGIRGSRKEDHKR